VRTETDRAAQLDALLANLAALLVQPSAPPAAAPVAPPRLLLTVDEAAEQLGVGRTTAWSLVRSGALESVQIGRLRRVHVDAVAAYAAHLAAA
jgi:excisionase family DNA binding protein